MPKYKEELSVTNDGLILKGNKMIIPSKLQRRILEIAHAGHIGIVKTKALIRSKVWFSGIDEAVENLITNCESCYLNNIRNEVEPLKPSIMPNAP